MKKVLQPAKTLGRDGEPKEGYLCGDIQILAATLKLKVKSRILTSGAEVYAK